MDKREEKLFLNNMGLVTTIADKHYKKFMCRGIDFEDIRQEGYVGLIKACERFNDSKGIKFSTYAYRVIEGHILNFILQDRHNFKTTMKNGEKTTTGIKHFDYEKTFNPVGVTFNSNFMLVDLKRVLTDREFFIMKKYYYEKYNFGEIGQLLKCSSSRARQIKNDAIIKIEKKLQFDL